ncbi:hypothetical protein [Paenibacillus donghaensis]|uniref:Uncharacterized protein n=1 Tax=Paenibacillus donghaensis TaxID=414771 RepID=A0A2Z2KF60_9BACL|nr:hypothetical protein [Paenibacillus donghaensis]ASA22595.1 hypothetical protein B9T62_18485 [Paenibacillus donghaensis]
MKDGKYGAWPTTEEELISYLHEQENQSHDYNTIAESLANVTVAMFNYFASKQGMTGFQCGWSGMEFIRKTKGIEGPFGIVDGSKLLYPQYDLINQVREWIEDWKPEVGKVAKEKLENDDGMTSPNVRKRWEELAALAK